MDPILYCVKCLHHFGLLKNSGGLVNNTHVAGANGICGGAIKVHQPVYAGIFLDGKSKRELLEKVPPLHVKVFAEHLTLAFGRHMREEYPLGKTIELEVMAELKDDRGQCVAVRPESVKELLWENQKPHITLSCAAEVKPAYSNELMKLPLPMELMRPLVKLTGIVDYSPRIIKEA